MIGIGAGLLGRVAGIARTVLLSGRLRIAGLLRDTTSEYRGRRRELFVSCDHAGWAIIMTQVNVGLLYNPVSEPHEREWYITRS